MWRQVCLPGDGGEENQRRLISKETTNCHAHKCGFHPERMGSLHWILSQRRTWLDLLFKLQSDSNRKKEQVKECRLEHRSSKSVCRPEPAGQQPQTYDNIVTETGNITFLC